MSSLDAVWANTQADGEYGEDKPAPAGYLGVVRIAGRRAGQSKRGELYFAVDLVDDAQGYNWSIYKEFTKNGQPNEGRIKSAKITLRQLGLEIDSPSQLEAALGTIVGRFYTVERVASSSLDKNGNPYVNTNITGVASPPTLNVAAPAPQVQAPTQVQTPQGVAQFAAAVGGVPAGATPDPFAGVGAQAQQQQGATLDQVMTGQVAPATQMQQQVAAAAQAPGVDQHPFS